MVLNYRNPDTITEVARNIKKFLAVNPLVRLVQWYDYPYEGEANFGSTDPVSSQFTLEENYIYGVNEIAKQVNADYPSVRIELFLYGYLMSRPESITSLDRGVLLEQANRERNVGKSDGSGFIGTGWESNLYDWINATGRDAIIYDHVQANYGSMWHYIPARMSCRRSSRAMRRTETRSSAHTRERTSRITGTICSTFIPTGERCTTTL
jgi:hypothetical protein